MHKFSSHSVSGRGTCRRRREQGVALVIVLAFVLLLTGLIVAFFSRATLTRQISGSSAAQTRVDVLAQSALQTVIGDLRQEMAAGSNADNTPVQASYTSSGVRVYIPSTTGLTPGATAVPDRASAQDSYLVPAAGQPFNDPLGNLLKRSDHNVPFYPNVAPYNSIAKAPDSRASDSSTTDPSFNGRVVSLARWNKGLLLPTKTPITTGTFPSGADITPDKAFLAPDWVIVTRGNAPGTLTGADSKPRQIVASDLPTLADGTGSNQSFAVGRFAYTVYDEGGMLDVNVAGNQLTLTDDPAAAYGGKVNARRGQIHQVNLDNLLDPVSGSRLVADSGTLLKWRASGTGALPPPVPNASPALGSLFDPLRSFSVVEPFPLSQTVKDQTFLSRQDLLNYSKANPGVVDGNAMKYLATFTRSLNAPSWFPTANATGVNYQYKDNAGLTALPAGGAPNPNAFAVNARWPAGHTYHDDNTTVPAGAPFLRRRFPLSKLALLTHTATWPGTDDNGTPMDSNIYRYFGLTRKNATDVWVYNHGQVDRIMSLQEVANSGRDEPDFFETLQAAILSGSLGRDGGQPGVNLGPMNKVVAADNDKALHVLAIGANIIDQYSSTNLPTHLRLQMDPTIAATEGVLAVSHDVYGVKNLPYFYMILGTAFRPTTTGTPKNPNVYGYFQPGVWNPHQVLAANSTLATPTDFRVRISGQAKTYCFVANTSPPPTYSITTWGELLDPTSQPAPVGSTINFSLTNTKLNLARPGQGAYEPTMLQTAAQATTDPINIEGTATWYKTAAYGKGFIGFYTGSIIAPDIHENPASPDAMNFENASPWPSYGGGPNPGGLRFYLEYLDPTNGKWNTYAKIDALQAIHSNLQSYDNASHYFELYGGPTHSVSIIDPRTGRMGATSINAYSVANSNYSLDPTAGINNGFRQTGVVAQADGYWPSKSIVIYKQSSTTYDGICIGNLGDNTDWPANYTYYNDLDGVHRYSAGARCVSASAIDGHPMQASNQPSRPVILSRPFRSVAEMGYAFRDEVWKNVDFGSITSGDAGMLDFFSVNDNPVVAGHVNLNTRNQPVLQAMIGDVLLAETDTSKTVPNVGAAANTAQTFAQTILRLTKSATMPGDLSTRISTNALHNVGAPKAGPVGPLINRAELATRVAPLLDLGTNRAFVVKDQQETVVRALAEAGETRTWNLLIDVVAQTGRYRPNPSTSTAKPLADQFIVEGEKRYWLHVALDRYTGKVIDQSLEPVYE